MSRGSPAPGTVATTTRAAHPEVDCIVAAALGWEARAVLGGLTDVRPRGTSGRPVWVGSAGRYRLLVVQTGIGPERVRMALAGLDIASAGARWLFSTGCAGALVPDLEPGALVVATRVVDDRGALVGRPLDAEALALQGWAQARGIATRSGSFASVGRPLLSAVEKRRAHERLGAIAVEMEGAALAAAAAERSMSLVAIRVILDGVDVAVPDFGAARNLSDLAGAVARHPAVLGRAARLWPAQRTARAALARFFRAFFARDALGALEG